MEREVTIEFNGKEVNKRYSKVRRVFTRNSFPKSLLKVIVEDKLFKQLSNKKICTKYNISLITLNEIIFFYEITGGTFNKCNETIPVLGRKNTCYYDTEEELLNLPKRYSWEELSDTEKQFYIDYGKEDDYGDDCSLE